MKKKIIYIVCFLLLLPCICLAKQLHLDSEYRNRWEEYHLSNGMIQDSREINWRDVEWQDVEKVIINIRKSRYEINKIGKQKFKGFIRFRSGGRTAIVKNGRIVGSKPINIWVAGWTDGTTAYLTDYDFQTGKIMKEYTLELSEIKNHVHPNLGL